MAINKIGKTSDTYKQIAKKEIPSEVITEVDMSVTIKKEQDMWDLLINKINELVDKVNSLEN